MSEFSTQPSDDDAIAWPASLRLEHGVFESRYRVLRLLSDGGMGEVVLAEHLSLGKRVAIKIMHPEFRGDAGTEERFILETRAAARIHHDNVVGISDFGRTADGRMFFVMEYLEGEDLAQTLRREGPLPWKRVVHITRHLCRGIGEAHRRGVIHRDIKPANCIRVARDGDPDFIKVVDFGLAKLFSDKELYRGPQTIAGVVLGTPGYMAPEVEAGQRPDPRVDLYGIGVLMVRLLTGKLPDEGGLKALGEMTELPPALLKMLHKALQEDPDERFQSASAMEEALEYVILATARAPALRSSEKPGARPITARNNPRPAAHAGSQPQAAARPITARNNPRPGSQPQASARPITARNNPRPFAHAKSQPVQASARPQTGPVGRAEPAPPIDAPPSTRPVTGRAIEPPRTLPAGRPISTRPASGPAPAARELEPPERRTLALTSGAMLLAASRGAGQPPPRDPLANMQPMGAARFVPAPEPAPPRSRSQIALLSLLAGLLVGLVVAGWMHMSQETDPAPTPTPAPAPVAPAPVATVVAEPIAPEPPPAAPTVDPAPAAKSAKPRRRTDGPATDLKNPFAK
jgi:serine/threonine protein kinase